MGIVMITQSSGTSWNGPICPYCNRGYIGAHQCSPDDLKARIADLERVMFRQTTFVPFLDELAHSMDSGETG